MKRVALIILTTILVNNVIRSDEGMWIPMLIKERILDMQKAGSKLSAEDIYSVNKASLKDAIVHFGGGCTGEVISDKGLIITNHHCGFGQIQSHSTLENDYLKDGFFAKRFEDELPNEGLSVKFLIRMEDVTNLMLEGTSEGISQSEIDKTLAHNRNKLIKSAIEDNHYSASVESFYYGNQYFLFVYEVFNDVRLVAAPSSSIGKFGGDTDNWMWPRHTGDFSIFRIYANKENKPSSYSKDNVPYKPKKYFKISTKPIKEGDFTMVYGYPGRTQQFLHSKALSFISEVSNPNKIALRDIRLDIQNREMSKSQLVRIKYAAKNANVSNAWKKWQGEMLGVRKTGIVNRKRDLENRFVKWSKEIPDFNTVTARLEKIYDTLNPYQYVKDFQDEAINVNEIIKFASTQLNYRNASKDSDESTLKTKLNNSANQFFKDYYEPIDKETFKNLLKQYIIKVDKKFWPEFFNAKLIEHGSSDDYIDYIFESSNFTDNQKFQNLLNSADYKLLISKDPATEFYVNFNETYNSLVKNEYTRLNDSLNKLYKIYVKALMQMDSNKIFYPDANSTLRITYGQIKGYKPADAIVYDFQSTLTGIVEKDNPDVYDYDVPEKMRDLIAKNELGRWAQNGTVAVAFIATNHTSGGNSGSPVIDAKGNLIGINFDRVWEGTMSDLVYDKDICRNISLDIKYVLFVLEKILDADRLFNEMDIK